jgi:hypothetical protein
MKSDNKIQIKVVDNNGNKITILIPKDSDFNLITDYISRSIQSFNSLPNEIIITDPGDEETYITDGQNEGTLH